MTASERLCVPKVSVCRAVERLIASGYFFQKGKRVLLTDKGLTEINEYLVVTDLIRGKLQRHCDIPEETAFAEAVGVTCALGEESRKKVLAFAKKQQVD